MHASKKICVAAKILLFDFELFIGEQRREIDIGMPSRAFPVTPPGISIGFRSIGNRMDLHCLVMSLYHLMRKKKVDPAQNLEYF